MHRLQIQDSQYLSKRFLTQQVSQRIAAKDPRSFSQKIESQINHQTGYFGWTKKEINYFIQIATNCRKDHIYLSDFTRNFPSHSESKCLSLYNHLYSQGVIKYPLSAKQTCTSFNAHQINSLTFIKGRSEYHVGHIQSIFDRYKLLNPMPDFIDQVTYQKMEIPAISQDGYVLDYYTWLKIIQDEKCNPFTRNPITSKRSLTILTIDNFELFRDKIINWDSIKPEETNK